jgi:hypothetical protein
MNVVNGATPNGGNAPMQVTAEGLLCTRKGGKIDSSLALEKSHVAKTTKGRFVEVFVLNTNASAQFIQIHDAAALPGNGAAPKLVDTVPASSSKIISFEVDCATGILVANSSTAAALTVGANDCFFVVRFD